MEAVTEGPRMLMDVRLVPDVWLWAWEIRAALSGDVVEDSWATHWAAYMTKEEAQDEGERRVVELSTRRAARPAPSVAGSDAMQSIRLTTGDRCPACHSEDIDLRKHAVSRSQEWGCRACAAVFLRVIAEAATSDSTEETRGLPPVAGGAGMPVLSGLYRRPLHVSPRQLLELGADALLVARVTRRRSRELRAIGLTIAIDRSAGAVAPDA